MTSTIHLTPASPSERFRALQEVNDFASTDMGWGGRNRWTYRMLAPEQINQELSRLCHPSSSGKVDSVTFQPCMTYEARSQDRHVVQQWDMSDGEWTFAGVFDGHCSHETVEYTVDRLPSMVKKSLMQAQQKGPVDHGVVSRILKDAIIQLDDSITTQFLEIFPSGMDGLKRLNDAQLNALMRSKDKRGPHYIKAVRCLRGSTVLITLTDPGKNNLWVANLGDCIAVLISKSARGSWHSRRVNATHNGDNDREVERIVREHPGEMECILDRRVLGYLAPTRAIGDTWMKLPAVFSRRIFTKLKEGCQLDLAEDYISRILTPPYLSNVPDVYHLRLRKTPRDDATDAAIVLCSDGMLDLYDGHMGEDVMNTWAHITKDAIKEGKNIALMLLRDAIGGNDHQRASMNLTVEMEDRWMDDTTVMVHRLLLNCTHLRS